MLTPTQQARLTWQCRRGMLELDILLSRFLAQQIKHLNEHQFGQLEILLATPDPDLYSWLMGSASPESQELTEIVQFIQSHSHA